MNSKNAPIDIKNLNPFETGLLRYLKPDQLHLIQSKKIGIGGAGGLGSNTAMMLIRSGFKYLEILDQDVIDASNLNRQQYFMDDIGKEKVQVLKGRLLRINPDAEITAHKIQWTETNGETFFKDCDVIVEAFDQTDWKRRFVEFYSDRAPFLVSGVGMAGLTQKKDMFVRKIGHLYFVGDFTTDTAEGHPPMAPRVTACAAKMAEIVLDLSLGIPIS